jgi:predicted AAA+ superfamily ATPase
MAKIHPMNGELHLNYYPCLLRFCNDTSEYCRGLKNRLIGHTVVLLNGARQTGKSTLVQSLIGDSGANYLTFDDSTVTAAAAADPQGFLDRFSGPIILDEIQRVPQLFNAIKLSVDRNRIPGRFMLTGSANVLLLPNLSQSLAGRMEILTLWPFSQGEIAGRRESFLDQLFDKQAVFTNVVCDRQDLSKKMCTGGYPEVVQRQDPQRQQAWFGSYITTILQRDVRDISHIESLTAMPRLLSLLATRAASLLNFAEISRSSGLTQTTTKRYMALLQMLFLIHLLPAWSGNPSKRLVKSPKLNLCDSGLLCFLTGLDAAHLDNESQRYGAILENFVVVELLKQSTWCKTPWVYFITVPNRSGNRYYPGKFLGKIAAVEIKSAASVTAKDFIPMRQLAQDVGDRFVRGVVLYVGKQTVPFADNLTALPVSAIWAE